MTSLLRAAVICAASLSLVAAAGCGGSDTQSSNDYVAALNKVQTDLVANVQKVGSTPSGGSSDPVASAKQTFSKLESAIKQGVTDLKGVQAPDKVKSLHNELIAEVQQFGDQVKAAGDSLNSKDPTAIVTAQTKFATSATTLQTKISRTIDAINKKLQG